MATRIEKARQKAVEAAAKVKELEKAEKAKEKAKAEAERRWKKIGKAVESAAGVEIHDISSFSNYIKQYFWKVQETQKATNSDESVDR